MTQVIKTQEEIERAMDRVVIDCPRLVDRDLDALAEGWDILSYPDTGYVFEAVENMLKPSESDELSDDTFNLLADSVYSLLLP